MRLELRFGGSYKCVMDCQCLRGLEGDSIVLMGWLIVQYTVIQFLLLFDLSMSMDALFVSLDHIATNFSRASVYLSLCA